LKLQTLKPAIHHFIGLRVETRRVQAMGHQLD
jgi:hypothetical protein